MSMFHKVPMNLYFRHNYGTEELNYEYPCWPSKYIEWTQSHTDYLITVDDFCEPPIKHKYNIAVLMEPQSWSNTHYASCKYYDNVLLMKDCFDLIFSTYTDYGDGSEKFKYYPGGCRSFIRPDERKIYTKTKNITSFASYKQYMKGHILRHQLKNWHAANRLNLIDYPTPPKNSKVDGLKDYRFEVVIENEDGKWFSEKIIDSFLCGCIPIYLTEIDTSYLNMFDMNGIILVNSIEQITDLLMNNYFTPELYASKLKSVEYNFTIAGQYASFGDVLWNHGLKELITQYE
jgi:hypothetical protein